MITKPFRIICVTPPGRPDPAIAIAASRAGGLGVLDLSLCRDDGALSAAVSGLVRYGRGELGVKLDARSPGVAARVARDLPPAIRTIVLSACDAAQVDECVRLLRREEVTLLLEVTSLEEALAGQAAGVDGLIAKGHEAGGAVREETTFILLQRILGRVALPVHAHGGIGLHTAAACYAAGAGGVVLDLQLALTRESALPEEVKTAIARMDGSETICLGGEAGESFRMYAQPGLPVLEELRREIRAGESSSDVRQAVARRVGWGPAAENIWLLGQDAAFAASLARRFKTVGGVVDAVRREVASHIAGAKALRPLDPGSPLARSHGTLYPIVQGPMTRVSDTAPFAHEVAKGGGLPMLALALLREAQVRKLLIETRDRLGDRPWGVGILGFVPLELRQEQLEAVRAVRPNFALIAGGRPDQARALEQDGIPTYLHVPSPGLLKLFLENGARRFVFEGRECGGHVGPRSSFVLWNTMIDAILEHPFSSGLEECHVLFAAGIHDALSASMVAAMAAPLAERGVKVGVLLGTAYLFTQEAVSTGAIVPGFQEEAVRCDSTVLLESGPGHSTRCADTAFASVFQREKRRLQAEGRAAEEIRAALEELNLGRLRIASKGITRGGADGGAGPVQYTQIDDAEQRVQGMYMIGQVAALRDRTCTIEELHRDLSVQGSERLSRVPDPVPAGDTRFEQRPCDVAIIGMGCLLPKAPDLQVYWENILNKVDAIREVPPERWDWRLYFDADPAKRDKIYSRWGGFLDDVAFDPMRYGMPPNSLPSIEPLQLLVLEAVRAALSDAGYLDRPFNRKRTSVVLGAGGGVADLGHQYGMRSALPMYVQDVPPEILSRLPEWTEDSFAGILLNVAAGRVANRFDLGGSNFTVDAACASSLAAVYLATQELASGSADMVIVGGADTVQNPFGYLCFSKTKALSPRGRCRTFDETADGIVISEGLAVLVLKRLADAERDGDRVYAVIKGVASSSDGRDKGLTAPRREGQILALERAYARAGFSPNTVGLIEAHGTGTVAGDQAEVEALKSVFDDASAGRQATAIGSVKSMIGHTKCTAGVASLIKVALALHHKVLPPTLNVETPNPKARFPESPFYVNSELRPWIQGAAADPRRAGVSSFGFGGTNFHVVLEEYADEAPTAAREAVAKRRRPELFLFRGASRTEILDRVSELAQPLLRGATPEPSDLALSLWRRARALDASSLTLAIVASSLDELAKRLASARQHLETGGASFSDPGGIYFTESPLGRNGRLAFLFPGQGSQYPNMLRDLAVHFPEVRAGFERAERALAGRLEKPLGRLIFPPPFFTPQEEQAAQQALTDTRVAQPALGAAGLALTALLARLGVRPDLAAGHSYGEYAALCAAGAFDEETLAVLSEARGRCIIEAAQQAPGTMAAVSEGRDAVVEALGEVQDVWVANLNAPRQTVLSGSKAGIAKAIETLKARGIQARTFPVACAFHSPLVAGARDRLARVLDEIEFTAPRFPVFSNTTAMPYPKDGKAVGTLLTEHLVNPVLFADEIEAMHAAGARVFLEVGPRNVLTGLAQQTLAGRPHLALACDVAGRPGLLQLAHVLAQLAVHGVPVDLERLFEGRALRELRLNALEEDTRPSPLPPTTWMVNGGRSRPLRETRVAQPPIVVTTAGQPAGPVAASADAPGQSPLSRAAAVAPAAGSPVPFAPGASAAAVAAGIAPVIPSTQGRPADHVGAGEGMEQVMLEFQSLMSRFLETQKSVMLAALQSGARPATHDALSASPAIAAHAVAVPAVPRAVAEPAPPIGAVAAPVVEAATAPGAVPPVPASPAPDAGRVERQVFQVVSERTGYPSDMLGLDVDMEAELGIDSIKRVEIFGTLQRALLPAERQVDQKAMEQLTATKTLRGVVAWFKNALGDGAPASSPAPAAAATATEPGTAGAARVTEIVDIPRFRVVAVEAPSPSSPPYRFASERVVVLTDDETGVARTLAGQIREQGGKVAVIRSNGGVVVPGAGDEYQADLTVESQVQEVIDAIRRRQGKIEGIAHLLPLGGRTDFEAIDLKTWRHRMRLEVKALHLLVRAAAGDLKECEARRSFIVGVTAMGGDSGYDAADASFPGQAGIAGYLKSVALDWPATRCRAIDLDPRAGAESAAGFLLREIATDDDEREIGCSGGRRVAYRVRPAPIGGDAPTALSIGRDTVVLLTGGARGITAEVAAELAECYRPTLLLAGRSPVPPAEEPPATRGLSSPQEIKTALMDQMRRAGETVSLPRVESAYQRLLKDREIRGTLRRLEGFGATVRYFEVDVRDGRALASLIDGIYAEYGRIDGVVHGAGVIEDKLVDDKTPESFDRVFDTKVDSSFTLSRALRPESLRFLAFFASVAGPFGSRGQCDYAAANEVLNRLALRLNRRWPGRIVSINWGPWGTTGMAGAEVQKQFQKRGIQIIPPAAGRVLLNLEIRNGRKEEAHVVIGDGPWKVAAERPAAPSATISAARVLPLAAGLVPSHARGEGFEILKTFDVSRDLYLQDHVLDGRPVVPAAVALELMAEVAQTGWPDLQVIGLRDFAVLKGLVLDGDTKPVRIRARAVVEPPHDRLGVDVHVEIADASNGGALHYRSTVEMGDRLPDAPHFDPAARSDLGPFPMPLKDAYRDWLFHGPLFQGIETAHGFGETGMVATCVPSSPALCLKDGPPGEWLIDPVVFDSALQMAVLWSRACLDMTPLPTRSRRYRRFGPLSPAIRCDMRVTSRPHPNSFVIDIAFIGPDGRLRGLLESMECACSPTLNRLAGSHLRWRDTAGGRLLLAPGTGSSAERGLGERP